MLQKTKMQNFLVLRLIPKSSIQQHSYTRKKDIYQYIFYKMFLMAICADFWEKLVWIYDQVPQSTKIQNFTLLSLIRKTLLHINKNPYR